MNLFVNIKNGTYRGKDVSGRSFRLATPWQNKNGKKYLRVHTDAFLQALVPNAAGTGQIICEEDDYEIVDSDGNMCSMNDPTGAGEWERRYRANETHEEAHKRIEESFAMLEKLTKACMRGDMRAVIVAGAPGVGKSYTVESTLKDGSLLHTLDEDDSYEIIKGTLTPGYLFRVLWRHRHEGDVVVFDDCDKTFENVDSANLLKGALDTGNRTIQWGSTRSKELEDEGIDQRFTFEGSVIFLTNVNMKDLKDTKSAAHLKALKDRCVFIDMDVNDKQDLLIRISQVIDAGLLKKYDFSDEDVAELYSFIEDNIEHLDEISLRTVLKIADIRKSFEEKWMDIASQVVMKPEAHYKRLYHQRQDED